MGQPAQQRSRDLAPGDKLGRYDLIRQIAVGGMGELYLARTLGIEGFEKLVVLKRILPIHVSTPSLVEMFLGEARLSATLHHANIAQVYDIGVEGSEYFFTMEYVHGEDLGRIAATAADNGVPLSLDAALTLIAGVCAGLHYAHEKAGPDRKPLGIVHRDVSPPNVLVSYDGGVKLVDFGIARAVTKPTTAAGGLKGKLAYMSPERCTNDPTIDRRSDVYSLGTLLFELTTGRLPFVADSEDALVVKIIGEDAPSARDIVPNFPDTLAKIIARALSRDRADRYATALEMQTAVEDFAHESRLRISGLVLARLMSTLFPARLEEWDHARKQGAFFVEQHIVQTMIEGDDRSGPIDASGQARPPTVTEMNAIPDTRPASSSGPAPAPPPVVARVATPPSGTPRAPTPAPVVSRAPTPAPVLAPTPEPTPAISRAPTPAPVAAREPTPLPAVPPTPARVSTPALDPPAGRSKPISRASLRAAPAQSGDAMQGLPVAAAGTLISSPAPDAAVQSVSAVGDVTAQVRWPTKRSKRAPWVAGGLLLAAGAAAAWAFSFGPLAGNTTITASAAPAPVEPAPTPVATPPPAAEPTPVVTPPPVIEPTPTPVVAPTPSPPAPAPTPAVAPDPKPVAPPTVAKKIAKRPKHTPPPRRPKPSAVEPKPEKLPEAQPAPPPAPAPDPKPETKDQPWNADSPFMPVRAH